MNLSQPFDSIWLMIQRKRESLRCVHWLCGRVLDRIEYTIAKIVSEYDQEIPQSQTADNPVAPLGRATQPSRDTRKTN